MTTKRKGKPALAIQGGPTWGAILPTEQPTFRRKIATEFRFCVVCERPTGVKVSADGKTYCKRHRHCAAVLTPGPSNGQKPKKREYTGRYAGAVPVLRKGHVWRLCVRCDGKLQKKIADADNGPFLCFRCKRSVTQSLASRRDVYYVPDANQTDPRKAARVDALAELYSTVDANGFHKVPGKAGPPPTAADLPFEDSHHDPHSVRADDEDFGNGDDTD